jgi:putative endonuclease
VGQTTDIIKRLKRHNQGVVPSIKYGVPWKVVLQIEVDTRSEALKLETQIKKRGAKRFIDDHLGVYHAKRGKSRPDWDAEVVTPKA